MPMPDHSVFCSQHLASAARHYVKALELSKDNIYAANGLGAVCASMGDMDAASLIFMDLREAAATQSGFVRLPDVRLPPFSGLNQARGMQMTKHICSQMIQRSCSLQYSIATHAAFGS